jgi:hypothetical protein
MCQVSIWDGLSTLNHEPTPIELMPSLASPLIHCVEKLPWTR